MAGPVAIMDFVILAAVGLNEPGGDLVGQSGYSLCKILGSYVAGPPGVEETVAGNYKGVLDRIA